MAATKRQGEGPKRKGDGCGAAWNRTTDEGAEGGVERGTWVRADTRLARSPHRSPLGLELELAIPSLPGPGSLPLGLASQRFTVL